MNFNRCIDDFAPYKTLKTEGKICLNKNESPFDIPQYIKERVLEKIRIIPFNRYPDIDSTKLREKVSEKMSISEDMIITASGSDALISDIMNLFEGEYIVTFTPTFSMYSFYARRIGLKVVEIPLDENFDIPDFEIDIIKKAHSVFIPNPNNPTGNCLNQNRINEIIKTGVPVILDEAYWEFTGNTCLDYVNEYDNVIILRTFSKAMGLSGLRIGMGFACKNIMDKWMKIKSPYNLNVVSEYTAIEILDNEDIVNRNIAFIKREKNRIYEEFYDISYQSAANFILMKADAFDFLFENGILVQRFERRLSDCIRMTVGNEKENDCFIRRMKEFLKKKMS